MKNFALLLALIILPVVFFSCTTAGSHSLDQDLETEFPEQNEGEKPVEKTPLPKDNPPPEDLEGESPLVIPPPVLLKTSSRMFWILSGRDIHGRPSLVYIQGTIHVGDSRLYPLSSDVLEAFFSSDNILAELSDDDNESFVEAMKDFTALSFKKAEGRIVTKQLTSRQKEVLYEILGAESVNFLTLLEPWTMTMALASLPLKQNLSGESSLDSYFYSKAKASGKKIHGLDSLDSQLKLVAGGSYSSQMQTLRELLNVIIKDGKDGYYKKMNEALLELYELYLSDDLERFAQRTEGDERNKKWAEEILSFLNRGGKTFVFAGAGHFIGKDSVFSYMSFD